MSDASTGNEIEAVRPTSDGIRNAVDALASGKQTVFSTIAGDDFDSKMRVLEATTASLAIADNLNKTIVLKDIVVQIVEMADEQTGELVEVPRTILIADDGVAYHAISKGVFRAVENILGILGSPDKWTAPVPVKVVREGTGVRQYFTIKPVSKVTMK